MYLIALIAIIVAIVIFLIDAAAVVKVKVGLIALGLAVLSFALMAQFLHWGSLVGS